MPAVQTCTNCAVPSRPLHLFLCPLSQSSCRLVDRVLVHLLLEGRCHPLSYLVHHLAACGDADCRRQPCIPDWRKGLETTLCISARERCSSLGPKQGAFNLEKVYYPLSLAWRQIVLYNYLPSLNSCAYWSVLCLLRGVL